MNRSGFSLIELIIVIAIMAVLTGVAVPYYQDSIMEARRNTLKSNLATLRQVLNQFRGDQRRGPLRITTTTHAADGLNAAVTWTDNANSELVVGPIQNVGGKWQRRTNVKYLPAFPVCEDPADGSRRAPSIATAAATYYVDVNGDNNWNIDTELAWSPLDYAAANASTTPTFRNGTDTVIVLPTSGNAADYTGSTSKRLDIVEIYFLSNDGTVY